MKMIENPLLIFFLGLGRKGIGRRVRDRGVVPDKIEEGEREEEGKQRKN